MRVLVTGASGFLGRHLLAQAPSSWSIWAPSSKELDVRDEESCAEAFRRHRPELCVHLAAQSSQRVGWSSPEETDRINRIGTEQLARSSGSCRLVYMSTCHVYGRPESTPIAEDHPTRPRGAYAISKLQGEQAVRDHARDWVILRGFNLLGPGQSSHFAVADWAKQALLGRREISTGNLALRRDYLDVRDAAAGILLVSSRAKNSSVLNLCSAKSVTLRSLFERAAPGCAAVLDERRLRADDPLEIRGCSRRARSLGWEAKIPTEKSVDDLVLSLSAPS